jgi:putative transposase
MLLVDARGVPLSIIVSAANRHDVTQLVATLDAIVVPRPTLCAGTGEHLCADAGFVGQQARQDMLERGYTPHVRSRGEESKAKNVPGQRARRWVVEVAHSWFTRFRKLLVRYEKTDRSYMALNMLAAAIIAFRKVPAKINIIYG